MAWCGNPDRPQFRIRLSNVYEVGQFAFTWNINYIASQFETVVGGVGEGRIPNWTTHDLQATWYASWDGRLTAGAQNVLDELPKVDGSGSYQYGLYNAYGRVLYLRYTQTF